MEKVSVDVVKKYLDIANYMAMMSEEKRRHMYDYIVSEGLSRDKMNHDLYKNNVALALSDDFFVVSITTLDEDKVIHIYGHISGTSCIAMINMGYTFDTDFDNPDIIALLGTDELLEEINKVIG